MIYLNSRSSELQYTGIERYASEIIKRISADHVKTISPRRPTYGIPGLLWEQLVLPRQIGRNDILWSPGNLGPLSLANQVLTIHDLGPIDHPEWYDLKVSGLYRTILPRLINKVAHIITDSEFSKQRILAKYKTDRSKISVVYPGVEHTDDSTRQAWLEQSATRSTPAPDRPYILMYGSNNPRKNIKVVLDSMQELNQIVPDLLLIVVGRLTTLFKQDRPSSTTNNVKIIGYVDDEILADLYRNAAAFVYPSKYEGFGLPPLEAMRYGTVSVVSDIPVMREVYGNSVTYVDHNDVESVTNGIVAVITESDQRAQLRLNHKSILEKYSWDRSACGVYSILNSIHNEVQSSRRKISPKQWHMIYRDDGNIPHDDSNAARWKK